MIAAEAPMDTRELLLQSGRGRAPHPLELLTRLQGSDEFHFYAQGVTVADFGGVFSAEIRALDVLIYRMPSELLNPNYWEPLTREAESVVREKLSGIVVRTEGDRALLWRSDRVARGRMLRDGLDVPVELLSGYIFRTTGEGLIKLGQAWSGRDRFEWAGLSGLPKGEISSSVLQAVHNDLSQTHLSIREESFLYASQDDGLTRVLFNRRGLLDRAIEALIRGFIHGATGTFLGHINRRVCGQIADLADGLGLSADPDRDVVDKGRTVEVHAHLGRTPWGVTIRQGREALLAEERAMIYYDRTAGLWAVAT